MWDIRTLFHYYTLLGNAQIDVKSTQYFFQERLEVPTCVAEATTSGVQALGTCQWSRCVSMVGYWRPLMAVPSVQSLIVPRGWQDRYDRGQCRGAGWTATQPAALPNRGPRI